jgi:hypothetical protein
MFPILAKWFGKKKRAVKTRLEEKDVLSIAREAASDYPNCKNLGIVTLENRSGDLVWIVSSATIGQTLHVYIDDKSSEILEIKQVGIR